MGKRKEVVTDVKEDSDLGSSVDSSDDESSSEGEKPQGLPLSNRSVAAAPTPQKKATKEVKKRRVEKKSQVAGEGAASQATQAEAPSGSEGASGAATSDGVKILKPSCTQAQCSPLHLVLSFCVQRFRTNFQSDVVICHNVS
jgi:hypothetical protein